MDMEELFTVILLTLINVIEIIYMITGSLLPIAAVLIFFILILVFMAVFMIRRKLFWRFALLAFIINLLNMGYMFLMAGSAIALYLALLINMAGIIFVMIQPQKMRMRKAIPISSPPRFSRIEVVCGAKEPALPKKEQSPNHSHFVEEFIRQLEENERLRELDQAE
jgi:predicted membrane protein